jgi:hypothetical protein
MCRFARGVSANVYERVCLARRGANGVATNGAAVQRYCGAVQRYSGTAVRCSGTAVRCSGTAVRCSGTAVRCSGTTARCSGTTARCSGTAARYSGAVRCSGRPACGPGNLRRDVGRCTSAHSLICGGLPGTYRPTSTPWTRLARRREQRAAQRRNGAAVRRCGGAAVQRCGGAAVRSARVRATQPLRTDIGQCTPASSLICAGSPVTHRPTSTERTRLARRGEQRTAQQQTAQRHAVRRHSRSGCGPGNPFAQTLVNAPRPAV